MPNKVQSPGGIQRPGGLEITGRGIALCGFPKSAAIADIGCGEGHTLRYLTENYSYQVIGVDINPSHATECADMITADAKKLPFKDSSLDGLIFECSFSKMEPPEAVLNECARVLKADAKLMISDLYSRGDPATLNGVLGRLEQKDTILQRAGVFGFELLHFEDYSKSLMDMWARLVFESGDGDICGALGTDSETLKRIKCGYYLAVFRKRPDRVSRVDKWCNSVSTQGSSLDALRSWQLSRIRETLTYAKSTEFYGRLLNGIDSAGIRNFESFEKLPFTVADDLSRDSSRFLLTSPGDVKRIVTQRSSGTSGIEKRMHFTSNDIKRTEDFFTYALSDYVRSGDRAIVFLSNSAEDGIGDLLRRAFGRIGVETLIHGNIVDFERASIDASSSSFYIGTPAEMLRLCRTYPKLSPSFVLLSADYIPASIIQSLKDTWNCSVLRHYGMTETCFGFAVDCAGEGGQHIRHADFYIEIIDPESGITLTDGRRGEIVITTLRSEALPLIRYRTGDLGCLASGICVCGSYLPRLGAVFGRLHNLANPVNIHALDDMLFSFDGVLDYRAEYDGSRLALTVDGSGVDQLAVADAFGVSVSVNYKNLIPLKGKRMI